MTSITANIPLAKDPAFANTYFVASSQAFFSNATPALATYRTELAKLPKAAGTVLDNPFTQTMWINGLLVSAAAHAAGTTNLTSSSFQNGLYALKKTTLGGMIGPVTYTPGKAGSGDNCYFVYSIGTHKNWVAGSLHPTCVSSTLMAQVVSKL
jgi:hypothetical protein